MIVTALRDNGRWSKTWVWRLRVIVGESLTIIDEFQPPTEGD
jgi:hypothetical protein